MKFPIVTPIMNALPQLQKRMTPVKLQTSVDLEHIVQDNNEQHKEEGYA